MEYVNLGKAGVKVSKLCLGCMSFGNDAAWKLEIDDARRLVKKSIDLGITLFDTANETKPKNCIASKPHTNRTQ